MMKCYTLLTTISLILACLTGITSTVLVEGPLNITRTVGEGTVVIPCPFAGRYQVIWKVDNFFYERFNLPLEFHGTQLIAVSSGLLMTKIAKELEGRTVTFQCFYPNSNGLDVYSSSIGYLTVTGPPPHLLSYFNDNTDLYVAYLEQQSIRLGLDHQRLEFGEQNKTFAWKSVITSTLQNLSKRVGCSMYNIIGKRGCPKNDSDFCMCEIPTDYNETVDNETLVTIDNKHLLDDDGNLARFNITELGGASQTCTGQTLQHLFQLHETVKTEVVLTSSTAKISLQNYTSHHHLVIPSTNNSVFDCICPLGVIKDTECYDSKSCFNIHQTAFENKLIMCKNNSQEYPLSLQISNITTAINGTKLHIYEDYNSCPKESCQPTDSCPYRNYVKALVIQHVLPEPPIFTFQNYTEFCFHSQIIQGVALDSYEVVIIDNTGQQLYNQPHNESSDHVQECDSEGFNEIDRYGENIDLCSPFFAFVNATNEYGSSRSSNIRLNQAQNMSDPCSCFKARVDAALKVSQNIQSLDVDVIENKNLYLSPANYEIRLSSCKNDTNFTTTCYNVSGSTDPDNKRVFFNKLSCRESYTLQLYYISPDAQTECFLNEAAETPICLSVIVISTMVSVLLIIIIIVIVCIVYKRRRSKKQNFKVVKHNDLSKSQYGTS